MRLKKIWVFIFIFSILSILFSMPSIRAQSGSEPITLNLSPESRKAFRDNLIENLVQNYQEQQVFTKIHEYMVEKAQAMHRHQPSKLPDVLIIDTFNKTENLFESTKNFIGKSFDNAYDPVQFERNVQKYLWLKGIGFFVLGIGDEHRMAFSYFYLPGNEYLKEDLLQEIVHYSYPEVPIINENKVWYDEMVSAMGRLGYNIFSVRKFGISE